MKTQDEWPAQVWLVSNWLAKRVEQTRNHRSRYHFPFAIGIGHRQDIKYDKIITNKWDLVSITWGKNWKHSWQCEQGVRKEFLASSLGERGQRGFFFFFSMREANAIWSKKNKIRQRVKLINFFFYTFLLLFVICLGKRGERGFWQKQNRARKKVCRQANFLTGSNSIVVKGNNPWITSLWYPQYTFVLIPLSKKIVSKASEEAYFLFFLNKILVLCQVI